MLLPVSLFLALTLVHTTSGAAIAQFDIPEVPGVPSRAIRSGNALYTTWANPTAIPYRIGAGFTATDISNIQAAMAQISTDMNSCIQFVPYVNTTNAGQDFIQISQTLSNTTNTNPVSTATCFSFPGRVVRQAGAGQTLLMVNTVDGCLGSLRDIMKYLVHALGLRNELNRADRETYIAATANAGNIKAALQALVLTAPLTNSIILTTPFDYKSITMPANTKYVQTGVLYNLANNVVPPATGQTAIGTLARLSQGDCVGLRFMYPTCTAATCADPYGNTPITLSPTAGTNTGTIINGNPSGLPLEPPIGNTN